MISVFVRGLLPDFFAIASSSKMPELCAAGIPPPSVNVGRNTPNNVPIRLRGFENATQKKRVPRLKRGFLPEMSRSGGILPAAGLGKTA
jgi:hypothetical protein